MNIQIKGRYSKDNNPNQNYINFIKKNKGIIHSQMYNTSHLHQQIITKNNNQPFDSLDQHEDNQINSLINSENNKQTIHDSLSRFKISKKTFLQRNGGKTIENQSESPKKMHNQTYKTMRNFQNQHNSLINKRTNHAKNEAAKELLTSLHSNKARQTKKSNIRQSLQKIMYLDPMSSSQRLLLKFPIIQKKNIGNFTIDPHNTDNSLEQFQKQIKMKLKQLQKIDNEKKSIKSPQIQHKQLLQQQRINASKRLRQRQQLYGLLPVFQTKYNKNIHDRKLNSKIQKNSSITLKYVLERYLQHKVISKTVSLNKQKNKANDLGPKLTLGNNFQYYVQPSNSYLEIKEEHQLIQNDDNDDNDFSNKMAQSQNIQTERQKQLKIKNKKLTNVSLASYKYDSQLTVYELKIRSYKEFLFMVNLAHRVFDPLNLRDFSTFKPDQKYSFYMGKGNNYLLVQSLLKRRYWWTIEEDPKKANFVWSQLKINYFYQYQKKSQIQKIHYKLDKDFQIIQPLKKKMAKILTNNVQPAKIGMFKAPLPAADKKIFTNSDKKYYDEFIQKIENYDKMLKFSNRLKYFQEGFFKIRNKQDISSQRMHNHLQHNYYIGNKKALFYNLKQYYDLLKKNVFDIIPLTFHIKHGTTDPQYEHFVKEYKRLKKQKQNGKSSIKNIWIVKPGELSNRGQGITVIDEIYELNNILKKKQKHNNGAQKTYIVQKYLQKPLLYKNRKFDIRHYMMISRLHGVFRAYWFGQGYIRTSSFQFKIDNITQSIIHLTNDAIQKYSQGYGKYQQGNKVSYNQFQRYMDSTYPDSKFNFAEMIYPKMKSIALDAIKATYLQLDPNNTQHNFQIFGLDFMIDHNYNVWLIEVNTNPCLQLSSKLLARIIPTMLQHSLRLTLDVVFPPPCHYPNSQKYLAPDNPLDRLQFELIFDENRDGKQIQQLYANVHRLDMGEVDQQDETYENDGKQIQLDNNDLQ